MVQRDIHCLCYRRHFVDLIQNESNSRVLVLVDQCKGLGEYVENAGDIVLIDEHSNDFAQTLARLTPDGSGD